MPFHLSLLFRISPARLKAQRARYASKWEKSLFSSLLPENDELFADVPIPTSHGELDQRNVVLVEVISEFGAAGFAGDSGEDDDFAAKSDDGVVILVRSGRRPRHQQRLAIGETVHGFHGLDQVNLKQMNALEEY